MAVPPSVQHAVADIAALDADTSLTPSAKVFLIAERRARACGDHFAILLSTAKTVIVTDADHVQWTISISGASYSPVTSTVELVGVTVLRNGVDVGLDPHQQIVNPPLLFPDPAGTITSARGTFRVDPAAVVIDVLIRQARGQ